MIRGKSTDLLEHERAGYADGFRCIAGIDEVGRGPLAGPVVAACVVFSPGEVISGVADSKSLSATQRERAYDDIVRRALAFGFGIVEPETIDRINILEATLLAMREAYDNLSMTSGPDLVLIDGNVLPRIPSVQQKTIVGGDRISITIAAASILAKVTRDKIMVTAAQSYPQYGFEQHKGYGSSRHLSAINLYGPCPIHRRSFSPMAQMALLFPE